MSFSDKAKTIGFTLLAWIVILVGINFICGLIVQNRYIAVDAIDAKTASESWGYFAPNQKKRILFPGLKEYQVSINPLGFRSVGGDRELTLNGLDGQYRILALGDSMTFGLFVNDEDSYPSRLQQIFKRHQDRATVLNAGVGSTTITDFLYYLKVKGLGLKPNLVIISFCENDLAEFREEPFYERIQKEEVRTFFKTVKLMKCLRVFRKFELAYRYRRSTNKIKDERVRTILMNESKDLDDVLYVANYQAETQLIKDIVKHQFKPLQDNVNVATYQSEKQQLNSGSAELRPVWQKYFTALDETIFLLKEKQVDLLYVLYPNIRTVFDQVEQDYQDVLVAYLQKKGVEYIDLRPTFKARKEQYLELYNNLPRDFHLSGAGNQIVAEMIYEKVKNRITPPKIAKINDE